MNVFHLNIIFLFFITMSASPHVYSMEGPPDKAFDYGVIDPRLVDMVMNKFLDISEVDLSVIQALLPHFDEKKEPEIEQKIPDAVREEDELFRVTVLEPLRKLQFNDEYKATALKEMKNLFEEFMCHIESKSDENAVKRANEPDDILKKLISVYAESKELLYKPEYRLSERRLC